MVRRNAIAIVLGGSLLSVFARAFGNDAHLAKMPLAEALETLREKHKLPALAAAAVREGAIVESAAVGVRKQGASDAVTIDDKWHIGSCTKSMTATLAAMLVEEGKLQWSTTVAEVFPAPEKMRDAWRGVTIEQLLTHRSGAPGDAPDDLWAAAWEAKGAPREQRLAFVRGLLGREPTAPPHSKFIYSNQGYAIAGAMLEKITGEAWEELLRERLFTPLKMDSAGFGAPGNAAAKSPDQPWGHRTRMLMFTEAVAPGREADNPAAIGPAGTVHCSIGDFARYAGWHARGARAGSTLLTDASFTKLHHAAAGGDYAMGWIVAPRKWAGGLALTHAGSNTMWFAVMWLAPEKDAAFVAATNIAGPAAQRACDDAVSLLIRRVLSR